MTMTRKKKYILITFIACILTAGISVFLYQAIHSARNDIATIIDKTLEDALHAEYYQQLMSDVYIHPKKENPKRKIIKYRTITAEGDTTYHFKDSIPADSISYLIHQHHRAIYSPMNVNEANAIFAQKLANIQLINPNKEKTGIIYRHKGKTLYSGNDSLSYQQAAYCMPVRFIDYPPSVEIQAWVDYGFAALCQYLPSSAWLITLLYIACMSAMGLWCNELIKKERREKAAQQVGKGIHLDEKSQICSIDGKPYRLAPLDFRLMKMFLEANEHFLTREDIKTAFWANISEKSAENNVNTHISKLRKMLQDHQAYELVYYDKAGYRLTTPAIQATASQCIAV